MNLPVLIHFFARVCCVMVCLLFLHSSSQAQLKAEFSVDKTGGCAPLTVSFTNKTTGASSNAVYKWDFGNGNSSTITNPGAIYEDEKTYTVKLTVQDGAQSSVKTQQITVYSKPTVDFSPDIAKGCLPLNVNFTSNSSPGSGSISSYYWDFGDGSTQQGISSTQPHLYAAQQLATVSLTVTNSFGCHNTVQKKDIVQILPRLIASFSADKTILCRESDPVQFINSSSGPGTLSYLWDFGDGATSTQRNPSHVFNKRGIYTVKLTVTSSEGCVVSSTQSGYINVATFSTNFTTPNLVCSERHASFESTSTPAADNMVWEVDGQSFPWWGIQFSHYFQTPGTHKVKLINTYGTCIDSAVKQIEVKPTPNTTGFLATVKGECGAPVAVDFRDTTADAVSWQWYFDWTGNSSAYSTAQAPTYTYTATRIYFVQLRVTNTAGCSNDVLKDINIPMPSVHIFYTSSSNNPPTSACGPITMKFGSTSTAPITQYRWNFGDGGTSTEAEPTYTFSKPGSWQVRLDYTTHNGCTGSAYFNSVTINTKPKADFSVIGSPTVCGNTPTTFSNLTTGPHHNVLWYVDGNYSGQGAFSSITYRFQSKGKKTIKLIAYNDQCSDTIEKVDYVEVLPPFVGATNVTNTCEGIRDLVTIDNTSREALGWKWDFGDGTSTTLTTDQPRISHQYPQTGTYAATLTVTNGNCSVSETVPVYVLLKKNMTLTMPSAICEGMNFNYTLTNIQGNPYPNITTYMYSMIKWEYDDGTEFTGYNNEYYIYRYPTFQGSLSQVDPTKKSIRLITRSSGFYCEDTTNFVPISIVGSRAVMTIDDDQVCFNTPVTFKNASTSTGSTITKWEWNFGDGKTQTNTHGGNVTHTYPEPGIYYAFLRVYDDKGCSSTTNTYAQPVTVMGPRASFTPSGTNVPLNTTVSFYNNTNSYGSYNTVYQWDFGDGHTASGYSQSHTYAVAGTYKVTLTVSDPVTQCGSQAEHTIVVRDFNTAFNFSSSFITSQKCPPVLVRFNNTSIGYTRIVWDFGDGITVENVNYPTHIYEKPGKYNITLYGYGPNGLQATHKDSIVIQEPSASLHADDLEGCIGNMITLFADADSTKSYIWDFGDGHVVTTTDSFFKHQYNIPGVYTPRLLVKDANGCTSFATMIDKIIIRPDPVVNITPAQPVVCLGQGTPLTASGGSSYSWSPAEGLSNSAVASPIASPITTTTYQVQATDDIGCKGKGSVTVQVVGPIELSVLPEMSVCAGNTVTIPASGAAIYNWINNTSGLSDTHIANPTATPAITTTYTVTGSDAHSCFTDTAEVTVRVLPLPQVNAGPDQEVQAGTPVDLAPTYSNDVIQWTWTPSTYLNCSNCPAPISTPLSQTTYTLTVKNDVGCTARDSVLIKMICDEARVSVPNAFSPNNDGKNDLFVIKGISVVKHMVIYNRWGQKVFERNNFIAADRSASWDGTLNGYPASAGTYVYFVEMQCPAGGVFTRKGSFVLVR